MRLKDRVPSGFDRPAKLPADDRQGRDWQEANRSWWEQHPMRYDWRDALGVEEFSKGFYEEIDRRFFENARAYLPWRRLPFDTLLDFDALPRQEVLEIGTGSGSHAQLIASHAKSYTGLDITEYAVRSTRRRLELFSLPGRVLQMDAEEMDFPDGTFDLVWSWGVIHHSSDTGRILAEMRRVLRPDGRAIVMVYHRSVWSYYIMGGLFHGVLRGDLLRTKSLHRTIQAHTDGAIARYYTPAEWTRCVSPYFEVKRIRVYGAKAELIPLPGGRVKSALMAAFPDGASRFLTNTLRWGTFLVSELVRRT